MTIPVRDLEEAARTVRTDTPVEEARRRQDDGRGYPGGARHPWLVLLAGLVLPIAVIVLPLLYLLVG